MKNALKALALLATGLAMSLGSPSANAAGWTGCHVGVQLGYAVDTTAMETVQLFSTNPQGVTFGGNVGCDVQMQSFVLGVFGDIDWSSASASTSTSQFLGTSASLDMDYMWTIGGRFGYLVTPSTLLYGTIGYTQASMSDIKGQVLALPVVGQFGNANGLSLGGGIEHKIANGPWSLKLEYRYTKLGDENVNYYLNGNPVLTDVIQQDIQSVRLGLTYAFNRGTDEAVVPLK